MFYALPNLRAASTFALEKPWEFKTKTKPPYDDGKEQLITWANDISTSHAFISGYEGVTAEVRVTDADNPPFHMHALLVDYDLPLPEDAVNYVKSHAPVEFLPNYLVETASGNARLVWLFEEPLLCPQNKRHLKEFLKLVSKQMKLSKWIGGLDTEALADPSRYYELGKKWYPVSPDTRINPAHVQLWMLKAMQGQQLDEKKDLAYEIPIEDIAAEVESRFPGRWNGPFVLGARGIRFWDTSADNPTAAVVCKDGMLCFTGSQFFVPWKQIFGAAFVDQYEADYVSQVSKDSAYDGRSYWVNTEAGWEEWSKEDFSQELRVRGYEGRKKPGNTYSEIDKIENMIKRVRRVSKALPFLYFKPGIITYKGSRYLNTSTVRPLEPAPPVCEGKLDFSMGKKFFPFIYKLLRTMFVDEETTETVQLTALMAWLKYAYCNALTHTPSPGQTIVLAGPVGKGKTLFSRMIVGQLLGGEADGSKHLVDGSEWTEDLVSSPLMRIDDALATSDHRGLLKFTNRLKKYTANAEMLYNQKYKTTGSVPWFGRIIITCNLDADSLKILPDMDVSTKDKISLFKASDHIVKFPDWDELGKTLNKELPLFARFLVDWTIPSDWVAEEKRFGVVPYHHPELFDESRQQGLGTVLELLHGFLDMYCSHNDTDVWEGTATQLYADLAAYSPDVTKEIKRRGLAIQLGKLSKNGYNLAKTKDGTSHLNIWKIGRDLASTVMPSGTNLVGGVDED